MRKETLKAEATLFILNKYKINVVFFDESYLYLKKKVRIEDFDTFSKWKEKVFGSRQADVKVNGLDMIAPNTLFSTVQQKFSSDSIPKAINKKIKNIEKNLEHTMEHKLNEIEKEYKNRENKLLNDQNIKIRTIKNEAETFSVKLLEECIEEQESNFGIELSVKQFFQRWLNSKKRIETREILSTLIKNYNASVSATKR